MKIVADISTTSRFLRGQGTGTPIAITALVPPALGPLQDGDSVASALSPGALATGSYASTEGAITAVSASVTINGAMGDVTDAVAFADSVSVALTVMDAVGNARVFEAGTRVVAGLAPAAQTSPVITGSPAPGETVTITSGTYTGTPAPGVSGTLTLGGVDVTGDMTGPGYTLPAETAGLMLEWSETAGNGVAPDASQTTSVTVVAAAAAVLDIYPGAAGAWSLRNLSGSTAVVVRVRRSSDNAEADFTADDVAGGTLAGWVGAGDGFVVTLYDQSGNARHASQTTAADQPRVVISGAVVTKNGLPATDVSDGDALAVSGLLLDGTASIFVATENAAQTSGGSIHRPILAGRTEDVYLPDGRGYGLGLSRAGADAVRLKAPETGSSPNPVNVPFTVNGQMIVVTAMSFGGSATVWINNGTTASSTYPPRTGNYLTEYQLFRDSNHGDRKYRGRFSEMIIYASDQSANRRAIEQDIADHYGVTLS